MEDSAVILAQTFLKERNLIAQAKLYEFCNMEVGFTSCLQIEIVPNTSLHTETDIVEGLIRTSTIILVELGTFDITVDGMIIIIVMA